MRRTLSIRLPQRRLGSIYQQSLYCLMDPSLRWGGRWLCIGFLFQVGIFLFLLSTSAHAQESLNNLPLPRWASLASAEVNLRIGPGERYPIDWVIKQKDQPVEITQEFENWRKVTLIDGTIGWVHRAMLAGTRYGTITAGEQLLYRQPDAATAVQAKLKKGVLVRLEKCQKEWCQAAIHGFEGWLPKSAIWGVYKEESWD